MHLKLNQLINNKISLFVFPIISFIISIKKSNLSHILKKTHQMTIILIIVFLDKINYLFDNQDKGQL